MRSFQQASIYTLLLLLLLTACTSTDTARLETLPLASASAPLSVIALGSCNSQDRKQPLWEEILKNNPQLWIWLGDNIYGDTEDMALLKVKYEKQRQQPGYQKLLATVPVVGIWDDHDYGQNNAGKEYAHKAESQQLFWDFVDEPANSPRRKQEGVYSAHTYGPPGQQVKVLLLDGRYHRDPLIGEEPKYKPNPTGDMLGEAQWQWLERELTNSTAQFHLIGSGLQFIADDHRYERWGNFPASRKRLFDLIARTKAANVILLSGDRHFAELSKIDWPGVPYPLYDLTSSGLTHNWRDGFFIEPNRHRVGAIQDRLNFGLLKIHWDQNPVVVEFQIRGKSNRLVQRIKAEYDVPALTAVNPKEF
ncbi:alkaline phosphatase D family protein [Rufibacter sp. LB8]|uniref:alkaline phosphatase D family protein n=1 Tax=Rufibacter sp. LB8 TaxID=2777781 RepID=UPI00178C26D9|nr:alkaline phosphatase D family protein [Rufibacter sp. LB8]